MLKLSAFLLTLFLVSLVFGNCNRNDDCICEPTLHGQGYCRSMNAPVQRLTAPQPDLRAMEEFTKALERNVNEAQRQVLLSTDERSEEFSQLSNLKDVTSCSILIAKAGWECWTSPTCYVRYLGDACRQCCDLVPYHICGYCP